MTTLFEHLKHVATCPKVLAYEQHLESLQTDIRYILPSGLLQPDNAAIGAIVPSLLNPQGVLQLCLLGSPTFQGTPHEQSVWDRRMKPADLVECEYRYELIDAWAKHLLTYENTCNAIEVKWSIQSRMRGGVADGLRFARDALVRLKEQGVTPQSPKLKRLRIDGVTKTLEKAIMIVTELSDKDYRQLKWDREMRPFARSSFDYLMSNERKNSNPYRVLLRNMREAFKKIRPWRGWEAIP